MQIVIDIPEELYKRIPTKEYIGYMDMSDWQKIIMSVSNGTPLPKGHGRLKDEKEVYKKFYCRCLAGVAEEVLKETTTIIEADKEEQG